MPVPNGYERALDLTNRIIAARRPGTVWNWDQGSPPVIGAGLALIRPLLDEMRATLRLEWRASLHLDAVMPVSQCRNSPGFREVARCFSAESRLEETRGNRALAMQRALDSMELGSALPHGDGMVGRLVAMVCHLMGMSRAERLALTLPAPAARDALHRVRQIQDRWPAVAETWESERNLSLLLVTDMFNKIRKLPLPRQWDNYTASPPSDTVPIALGRMLWPRRMSIAAMDRHYRRRIAESRKPARQRRPVPAISDPLADLLSSTESLEDGIWKLEWPFTQNALLEAALAVRIHRLERGRYPETLAAIDRRWLPAVPCDQWDQPVRYRLRRGEPVLYSLGPDGRDDGGRATDAPRQTPKSRGDLVFGWLMRRPKPPGR